MPQLLSVAQLGNPILRQVSTPILDVQHPEIQTLIQNLTAIAAAENGVGIAAPQVGKSLRLFIVASRPNPRYPHAPKMEPTAMINPKILEQRGEVLKDWEGCLCVPGLRGLVPRHQAIAVEYLDIKGQVQQRQLTDFVARIFQHELDHLNGVIFVDRVETTQDLATEQEYLKQLTLTSTQADKSPHVAK